jgi:hypothetical protein
MAFAIYMACLSKDELEADEDYKLYIKRKDIFEKGFLFENALSNAIQDS